MSPLLSSPCTKFLIIFTALQTAECGLNEELVAWMRISGQTMLDTCNELRVEVDEVVCLMTPEQFYANRSSQPMLSVGIAAPTGEQNC